MTEETPRLPGVPGGAVFTARYQPIVELRRRRVVAHAASLYAEAGGVEISPAELFRAATEPEAAAALDRIGRATAIRGAAGWLGPDLLFLRLVPAMVARPQEAPAGLDRLAAEAGITMGQVVVEVALSGGKSDLEHLARVVARCRGAGCQVAVVDVGDARTMRHTVAALAPDFVKLGRSLAGALRDSTQRPAVDATIAAAHAAGSRVIAFGVETEQQARWVGELGADWGQGWLFGRPRRRPEN